MDDNMEYMDDDEMELHQQQRKKGNIFRYYFSGFQSIFVLLMSLTFLGFGLASFSEYYKYKDAYINYKTFIEVSFIVFIIIFGLWTLALVLDFFIGDVRVPVGSGRVNKQDSMPVMMLKDYYDATRRDHFFYYLVYGMFAFVMFVNGLQLYRVVGRHLIDFEVSPANYLKISMFLVTTAAIGSLFSLNVLLSLGGNYVKYRRMTSVKNKSDR